VVELMARWATPTSSSANRDLREHMAQRAESIAEFWLDRASTKSERAYIERTAGAMAGRWRSDEPMEVAGWQLPSWAPALPSAGHAVVLGDGSLMVAERRGESAEVIDLRSRADRH
jgi:hypothetical protein